MNLFDNRYKKEDLIGRGAFSEVWRVTDTYTNAVMALKIYTSSSQIDDDGLEMLKHEFALMIDADHQNLLRPLHFGVSAEGRLPYLTLPYCKGGNISKMMGRMTEWDAWKLIRDTASALAYLHAMNPPIIHQDIKPANIMIGNDGYYKLSDFGVSIHARSALSSKTANGESAYNSAGTISEPSHIWRRRNSLKTTFLSWQMTFIHWEPQCMKCCLAICPLALMED